MLMLKTRSRSLGPIFASGNVNFMVFVKEHTCNQLCQPFGITGEFSAIDAENTSDDVVDMQFSQA